MGQVIDPAGLTESGETCLRRLCDLAVLDLPTAQLITAVGTVVEAHVSRVLQGLIDRTNLESDRFGHHLLTAMIESIEKSWDSRNDWMKKAFQVGVASAPAWTDFKVVIDARNAVVHGDGSLTRRQGNNVAKLRREFRILLDAHLNPTLMFTSTSPDRIMKIARKFVADFDQLVITKHQSARSNAARTTTERA